MPTTSRTSKSPGKTRKKATKKASRKVAKKVNKKVAKKAAKKAAKKTARRPQSPRQRVVEVPAGLRHEMIAKAAYYCAEKRNFQGGDPVADWLFCEKQVDARLSKTAR